MIPNLSDTELILLAAKKPVPHNKTQYHLTDLFAEYHTDELQDVGTVRVRGEKDPINELGRKEYQRKKKKTRPLHQWTATDFTSYLKECLKEMGVLLQVGGNARAGQFVGNIHDNLVDLLKDYVEEITNEIIKDYLDWWMHTQAHRFSGAQITLGYLDSMDKLNTFCNRYRYEREETPMPNPVESETQVTTSQLTDEQLYGLGLEMFLIERGIVNVYHFLQKIRHTAAVAAIQHATDSFSKPVLQSLIKKTLDGAPYRGEFVDFFDVVRPALVKNGLQNEYSDISVGNCFKGY
jgi:hypothetical protein